MTDFNKRVYEMLVRVLAFGAAYRDRIVNGSPTARLFGELETAFQKFSARAAQQTSGKDAVRVSSGERAKAREELIAQLERICRTAFGLGLKQFWMPRDRSDRAFVRAGQIFAEQLEPLKPLFIENHIPADFIEKLKLAVERLERVIQRQAVHKGSRVEATAAIEQARSEALSILERLDPIMDNLLHDNLPVLAAWESVRRIEKGSSTKSPPPIDEGVPAVDSTATPQVA